MMKYGGDWNDETQRRRYAPNWVHIAGSIGGLLYLLEGGVVHDSLRGGAMKHNGGNAMQLGVAGAIGGLLYLRVVWFTIHCETGSTLTILCQIVQSGCLSPGMMPDRSKWVFAPWD